MSANRTAEFRAALARLREAAQRRLDKVDQRPIYINGKDISSDTSAQLQEELAQIDWLVQQFKASSETHANETGTQ